MHVRWKAAKDGEGGDNGTPSHWADVANVAQRLRSRRLFNGGRDEAEYTHTRDETPI